MAATFSVLIASAKALNVKRIALNSSKFNPSKILRSLWKTHATATAMTTW
jgi:hypothetical protein